MDIRTLLIALGLGYGINFSIGSLLNSPDCGTIAALAYLGAKIVYKLDRLYDKNNQ